MPNLRASYEAEAMMPRFSPPTAMGLPRKRGSEACSTEAKKASASRWTMERGRSTVSGGRKKWSKMVKIGQNDSKYGCYLRFLIKVIMTLCICISLLGIYFGYVGVLEMQVD